MRLIVSIFGEISIFRIEQNINFQQKMLNELEIKMTKFSSFDSETFQKFTVKDCTIKVAKMIEENFMMLIQLLTLKLK